MEPPWLQDLLGRRLLLVTGKGGTGKSTCAAALALAAVRSGRRCLLVEVESRTTARGIFGIDKPSLQPRRSASGVEVASIDFQHGVEEVVHDVMRVPRVVRVMLRHPVISRFLRAAPSALDFVTMYLTARYAGGCGARGGHDLVVVDMPAFGHAKIVLAVGRTARDLFRVGPIATRGAEVDELLRDPARTKVVVVTLPEEMPVTETIEGCHSLEAGLGLSLGPVIVNCTEPRRLGDAEASLVEAMAAAAASAGDPAAAGALRRAAEWSRWAAVRRSRVERLREDLAGHEVVEVPLFAGAVAGIGLAERVASALEGATPEASSGTG